MVPITVKCHRGSSVAWRSATAVHPLRRLAMPKMTEINKSMTVAGLISSIQPPEKQNDVKKILQVLKKYSKDIHVPWMWFLWWI